MHTNQKVLVTYLQDSDFYTHYYVLWKVINVGNVNTYYKQT